MSEVDSALAEARSHLPVFEERNQLKLGTFATNASYGASMTDAPTTFEVSWRHTLGLARQVEDMGLDMIVPIGRWRGFGGSTDFNGESFETYTWAAGLAQATERIMVFATSHVPTIHPIVAAKQAATIDHISNGRFGLNLVMGWFKPEMEMFGSEMREHDVRYDVGEEWLQIVKHLWTEESPFSFAGDFFTIKEAQAHPKPVQRPHPVIMNAGASPAGSDFSARNADISFITAGEPEAASTSISTFKNLAHERYGREPRVFSGAYVVCRDTEKEAQAAMRAILDGGDRVAVHNLMSVLGIESGSFDALIKQGMEDRFISGWGAPLFVGTPEQVTDRFVEFERAGVSGLTLAFLDYQEELKHFDDAVMPLLRQVGLRD